MTTKKACQSAGRAPLALKNVIAGLDGSPFTFLILAHLLALVGLALVEAARHA